MTKDVARTRFLLALQGRPASVSWHGLAETTPAAHLLCAALPTALN